MTVKKMVDAVRPVARTVGLLKEEPLRAVLVELKAGAQPQAASEQRLGVSFEEVRGNAVLHSLAITDQNIRYETSVYTRWVAFREIVTSVLSTLLPIVSQSTMLASIALEYVDVFYAINSGPADVGQIVDRQSAMIVRKAFSRRQPFHSYSGWFEKETPASHHLVNVDVTVSDANGPAGVRRVVNIRTHEAERVTDASSARANEFLQLSTVVESLDRIHVSMKRRLGEVLTRDASRMISLGN